MQLVAADCMPALPPDLLRTALEVSVLYAAQQVRACFCKLLLVGAITLEVYVGTLGTKTNVRLGDREFKNPLKGWSRQCMRGCPEDVKGIRAGVLTRLTAVGCQCKSDGHQSALEYCRSAGEAECAQCQAVTAC